MENTRENSREYLTILSDFIQGIYKYEFGAKCEVFLCCCD